MDVVTRREQKETERSELHLHMLPDLDHHPRIYPLPFLVASPTHPMLCKRKAWKIASMAVWRPQSGTSPSASQKSAGRLHLEKQALPD
jgi:hypothetical protein